MSFNNFEKALKLAKQCDDYFTHEPKTEDVIKSVEQKLNINFSMQNKKFYQQVGYLSFFGVEIYGIYPDGDLRILAGNSFASAIHDRKRYDLPAKWLPIYFFDDGCYGYLDYSQLNKDGEPPVIMATYNGKEYRVIEKVADDFGDFLLNLVQGQLENQ